MMPILEQGGSAAPLPVMYMKQLLRVFCLLLAFVLFCAPVRASAPFSDVQEDFWYSTAVLYTRADGLMNGVGNRLFAPGDGIEPRYGHNCVAPHGRKSRSQVIRIL